MTEENRAKNIAIEAGRGDESLDSARILLAAGKYADSVSRAYYGAFHYARRSSSFRRRATSWRVRRLEG